MSSESDSVSIPNLVIPDLMQFFAFLNLAVAFSLSVKYLMKLKPFRLQYVDQNRSSYL